MIMFTAGNQNLKIRISRECIKWVLNANMLPGQGRTQRTRKIRPKTTKNGGIKEFSLKRYNSSCNKVNYIKYIVYIDGYVMHIL